MAAAGLALPVVAADVNSVWNGASGLWNEPTNWTHSPPTPGATYPDNAALTYDATLTNGAAELTSPVTVQRLTLGGAQLTGNFDITARELFTWAAGDISGDGLIAAEAGLHLAGTGNRHLGQKSLNLYSNSVWSGSGSLSAGGGAIIQNLGTLDLQSDSLFTWEGSPPVFRNLGVLRKSAGNGVSRIEIEPLMFGSFFESSGVIEVQSGLLDIAAPGQITGPLVMATGAVLRLSHGMSTPFTIGPGVEATGGGMLLFQGLPNLPAMIETAGPLTNWTWLHQSNATFSVGGTLHLEPGSRFTLSRSSTFSGAINVADRAVLEITDENPVGMQSLRVSGNITNAGAIVLTGNGEIEFDRLNLVNDGVIDLRTNARIAGFQALLHNHGVLQKSDGDGQAEIVAKLVNDGLVTAQIGTLRLSAVAETNAGRWHAQAGAALLMDAWGESPVLADGTMFSGEGVIRIQGTPTVVGTVTNTTSLHLFNGGPTGPGIFVNETNGTIWLTNHMEGIVGSHEFRNFGLFMSGYGNPVVLRSECVLNNFGTLVLGDDATITGDGPGVPPGTINNWSTIAKLGPGSAHIGSDIALHNAGRIEVHGGILELFCAGKNGGVLDATNGASMVFNSSGCQLIDGAVLAGPGTFLVGSLDIEGNATNLSQLVLGEGSTLEGSGLLVIDQGGTLSWLGGMMGGTGVTLIAPAGKLVISNQAGTVLSSRRLHNQGSLQWTNPVWFAAQCGASVVNEGTMEFVNTLGIQRPWSDSTNPPPWFLNAGALRFVGSTAAAQINGVTLTNTGSVEINNTAVSFDSSFVQRSGTTVIRAGSLTVAGPGLQVLGGAFQASGTVDASITNNAELSLGPAFGKLDNRGGIALGSNSLVRIRLGGTAPGVSHDQINLLDSRSSLDMNGTLSVELAAGYQPQLGERYRIMTFRGRRGWFGQMQGLYVPGGLRLAPQIIPDQGLELVVTRAPQADQKPLAITRAGWFGVQLNWPAEFTGFFLQSTTNLASGVWQTYFLTSSTSAALARIWPMQFFRLVEPYGGEPPPPNPPAR